MGASITKEEKKATRYINERLFCKIEHYRTTQEARYARKLVFTKKKLLHKKEGDVLAVKGQLSASFMLISGTIQIGDFIKTRPGMFNAECLFSLESFQDIKALTACTILQFNPNCNNLHTKKDLFEKFLRYVPIYPIQIHNPKVRRLLNINELNQKYGSSWWSRSIATSFLDRTAGLSSFDPQFDVSKRPDFRDSILEIMDTYRDFPKFISVPAGGKPILIQEVGQVPNCAWILAAGTATAKDDEDPDDPGDTITDMDTTVLLETEACLEHPAYASYRIEPQSIAISICRKTILAIQFMKTFSMSGIEAVEAVDASHILTLKAGDRIEEDKWFKGIIFHGKLSLVALPPGRASEFEKYRRTVIEQHQNRVSTRKSCRIATVLEYGFEKCGPFDEFVALQPTIVVITTGVPDLSSMYASDEVKLSTIKESEEFRTKEI